MDKVVNNIREKLSADSLVEMMKEAKVIDDELIKEDDVRKTLDKLDMDSFIHTQELAEKLNKLTEEIAINKEKDKTSRSSIFSVMGQSNKEENRRNKAEEDRKPTIKGYDEMYFNDNIRGFLD